MPKLAAVRWNRRRSAGDNARRHLPEFLKAWFAEGRSAARRGATEIELHNFRLRTKALRYTLELFRGCYGGELKSYLDSLRRIQDSLGAMSDCVATRKLVAPKLPARSAARRTLETFLARRAQRELARFTRYWQRVFAPPAAETRWLRFFGE
jgi:CHAD domain-containing protein